MTMETILSVTIMSQYRYRQFSLAALAAFAVVQLNAVRAQDAASNSPAEVTKATVASPESEGIWPSDRLLKVMLNRWVEESCAEFEMDEDQRGKVRERMVKQWSEFLTEKRGEIQPLANEFMEMRLNLNPPEKESVKQWAERAMPVFDEARKQITESHGTFREVLRPEQRLKFEAEAFQMGVGMQIAEEKIKLWKEGEFDKNDIWAGSPAPRQDRRQNRRRRMEEQRAAREEMESRTESDQIVIEMGAWEKYVAGFIARFTLDQGQRDAAGSFLHEMKTRALAHRDRHRDEIAKMERAIRENSGSEDETTDIKKQLLSLYGPIDEMFQELKDRLDKLPTTVQRETRLQLESAEKAGAEGTGEPFKSAAP